MRDPHEVAKEQQQKRDSKDTEPCVPLNLLVSGDIIQWLVNEVNTLEYEVGSINICREDRAAAIKHARKALWHMRSLQSYSR